VIDPAPFKRENAFAFGATHVFARADLAQEAVIELTRGQLADHALITIGVLSSEVVEQAARSSEGRQVTITSVGKSAEKQIQLAANGSVVGCSATSRATSSACATRSTTFPACCALPAGQLKLEELITRRYSSTR